MTDMEIARERVAATARELKRDAWLVRRPPLMGDADLLTTIAPRPHDEIVFQAKNPK